MDNPFTIKEAAKPSLTASFVANNKAGEHLAVLLGTQAP
jgi:hypothetical protein